MKLTRFWMVWNRDGGAPRFCHGSKKDAEREAARLAQQHPGRQFVVLKAVSGCVSKITEPETIKFVAPDPEDIPF